MLVGTEEALRAVASRDARFDGCFIHAVRSTGIYCRPSCPARTPKRDNSVFFATAAAAQAAGYRACRRCLPDAVPGSPEWNLRADLAGRAMRLITDGVVDRCGVRGLADQLGYSERHLTRVLTAELGAGPLGLARAHRAHSARILIETTSIAFGDIAFAAGFSSLRQFNDTLREVFDATPTEMRSRAQRRTGIPSSAGVVQLRLPFRVPCDVAGVLRFLGQRALTGLEDAGPDHYTRALRLPYGTGIATLRPHDKYVACTLRLTDLRDLGSAVSRLRRLLDLDADPVAIGDVLGTDPALRTAIARTPGVRVPGSVDGLEIVVRAVIGQQISVAAARKTTERLVSALGERLPQPDGAVTTLFPTPGVLAERALDALPGPRRRAETVRAVAEAVAEGRLALHPGRDAAELRHDLESISGIGPWTSSYASMRVLGCPDVLLIGDLALRRGAGALGLSEDPAAIQAYARRWSPWSSYAGVLLWEAAVSGPPQLQKAS
ncbi:helix-turn-helix domain-containing protein [Saccharopolyspora sp. K220]|uniref:DNA-3-methyladenine glycosylase 2 family protein n=1 Tax=Saccharopolyspora soli TaxID=2926618 RepID=UPI001F562F02|nr:AlkA N-terminal domain-containing protein [Saccharopolyspora soli]MCI2417669.1 helix-turn-helix domain-containing protein [Saccharopolyspora soli]